MNLRLSRILATFFVLLLVASCRTAPVYNVERAALTPPAGATMEDIDKAIIRAGAQLGWQVSKTSPGNLVARLPIRRHLAVVDIRHDSKEISITYKDSTNLNYDPEDNEIHSNYNGWIQNLQNAIFAQVAAI